MAKSGRFDRQKDSADHIPIQDVSWSRKGLLEGSAGGRMPWSGRKTLSLVVLPLVALLALGTWWGADHIENDIEAAAPKLLSEHGIDPAGLVFNADYRNVKVSGTLPDGTTGSDIERILEEQDAAFENEDIRNATITAVAAAPAEPGPVSVNVVADGEMITLVGNVPSETHSGALEAAAAEAVGAANVINNLTVSGLEPSSTDPDGQIGKLARILPTLGAAVVTADLAIGDAGDVTGSIEAQDGDTASAIAAVAGADVAVSAPTLLGSVLTRASFDGTRIVLDGDVLTDSQRNELGTVAAEAVGAGNVVNNLRVLDLPERVAGSDDRVSALAAAIRTFENLNSGEALLDDTDLTINGEAADETAKAATDAAIEASANAGLRPGGTITVGEPKLTLQDEIDLLQTELDNLQDEIRENVVFATDSDELDDAAMATLDKVVAAMDTYQLPVVETGGHTDSQASEAHNLDLSQRRADSVVEYIESQGVQGDRLNPVGYGEAVPIADNLIEEGRKQNRRVEFIAQESF